MLTVNLAGIIQIFGKSLYNEFGAIVRELVQNGHDAVIERHAENLADRDTLREHWVNVQYHSFERVLVLSDNGTGMDDSEVSKDLNDFGRPKKSQLRDEVTTATPEQPLYIIGLYGVGFLSALAVSDTVEVWTRKSQEAPVLWIYASGQDFATVSSPTVDQFEEVYRKHGYGIVNTSPCGTVVICRLSRQVAEEYQVSEEAVRDSLTRYARLLRVPIYFNNDRITDDSIAWAHPARASREDWRQMITDATGTSPLLVIPVYSPPDRLDLEGVLWIPERRNILGDNGHIDIYVRRMFVCPDDKLIRPAWARFIMGMVNSNKMGRIVSGNTVIDDNNVAAARDFIKERILTAFKELSDLPEEEAHRIIGGHDDLIKNSAADDPEFLAQVWNKLRVKARNQRVSMPEYLALVKKQTGRENVVYYYDKSVQEFSAGVVSDATRTPVLTLWTLNDGEFVRQVCRRQKLEMLPYTDLFKEVATKPENEERYRSIIAACAAKKIAADVREFDPPHIPAMLIEDEDLQERKKYILGILQQGALKDKQLADEWQSLSFREGALNREVSFYLNAKNPLIDDLVSAPFETQQAICLALYNISFMSIMPQLGRSEVQAIYNSICSVLKTLLEQSRPPTPPPPVPQEPCRPTRLFMITPFAEEYKIIEQSVRDVFEGPPYFFQVVLSRDYMKKSHLLDDVVAHMDAADGFVAEITEQNPNVMFELGAVIVNNSLKRPVLLLQGTIADADRRKLPADLQGKLYIAYGSLDHEISEITAAIRSRIEENGEPTHIEIVNLLKKRTCRALTKWLLAKTRCDTEEQEKILAKYRTIEAFLEVTPTAVEKATRVSHVVVKFIQDQLREFVTSSTP